MGTDAKSVPVNKAIIKDCGMMKEQHDQKQPEIFDILTVLGHDLKSPLNAVEAYLELLRGRVLGDTIDSYSEILDNSIARLHHMRTLITDVVDWSRLDSQSGTRQLARVDMSKTARAMVEGFVNEAYAANITILADIEDGLFMDAVPKEMELMVHHLMDNAVKYNRQNGTVRVTMKREGAQISLKVADTGIGMTAEDQDRLFQEFSRVKNSRTQDIRGTGLGLAIIKRILALYQGTVSVQSEPDKGTTFSVALQGCIEQE